MPPVSGRPTPPLVLCSAIHEAPSPVTPAEVTGSSPSEILVDIHVMSSGLKCSSMSCSNAV